MNLDELKQGYLDLIRAELSLFGIDPSQVSIMGACGINIEEHLVDMSVFSEKANWIHSIPIRSYSLDDQKTVMFLPTRDHYDQYRNDDEMSSLMESIVNEVNLKVSELSKLFVEQLAERTFDMTLDERIADSIKDNLKLTHSLSDIHNWKAKIILGNSVGSGEGELGVGDFDSVGYTWIGITTGLIIPVARGDEHNKGGDLIHYLISKNLIPQDTYYPIFYHHDYVDTNDSVALNAFKIWRKLGGPNMILNKYNRQGDSFQITIDDYIRADGNIVVKKGELLPIGKKFVEMLTVVSKLCIEATSDNRKEKRLYVECLKTYNYYIKTFLRYPTDEDEALIKDIMKAESTGGLDGIRAIEQMFFGFDGLKNKIHNEIRKSLNTTNKFDREMQEIFGDLDLANHLFGSM